MHKYYCECGGLILPDLTLIKLAIKLNLEFKKGKTGIKVKSLSLRNNIQVK